ncbi:MAG TPA: type II toxin-antitoxin system HicB family antitoxin [Myxococcaceae bacterium]|nr:type II toxin-antitoxin system HicB family antitoxin [Myxococcaceae bacterium]
MRYSAVLTREGKATLVAFPEAPGCQTFAEAGEDVEAVAREALEGWLEAHLAAGEVPPATSGQLVEVPKGATLLWVDVPSRLAAKISLRRARHEAGFTQAELARRAGLSQPQLAKLESPDSNPTLDTLERVAEALGVRLTIGFEPRGEPSADKAAGRSRYEPGTGRGALLVARDSRKPRSPPRGRKR